METKIKLDKDTFEVLSNKIMGIGSTAGAYALYSDAEYYIVVTEEEISLKSVFCDVVYHTTIDEIDSIKGTMKIKGKLYKYKIVE